MGYLIRVRVRGLPGSRGHGRATLEWWVWERVLSAHLCVMRDVSVKGTWLGFGLGSGLGLGPELGLWLGLGF